MNEDGYMYYWVKHLGSWLPSEYSAYDDEWYFFGSEIGVASETLDEIGDFINEGD